VYVPPVYPYVTPRELSSTGVARTQVAIVGAGPYRFTRNPMYLGMVLLCIAAAILLASEWILALTPVCALALWWFAVRPEEAYLEEKFGEGYRAYKRRVRRWI